MGDKFSLQENNICIPQVYSPQFSGGLTALMPIYWNCDNSLLHRALDSIFQNTVQPDEVLVVIDGPIQNETRKILTIFEKKYSQFTILQLNKNQGLATALNEGIACVKTKWVARCDQDDINYLNRFEVQLDHLNKNQNVKLIGSYITEVDVQGKVLGQRKVPISLEAIKKQLPFRNPFNHMSVIFDNNFIRRIDGYPNIAYQDYGLWIKAIGNDAEALNIPEPLVYATTGDEMFRRRGGLRIAIDEFRLHKLMAQYHFRSWIGAMFWAAVRATASLMPSNFKKYLYRNHLRK